MKNKHTRHIGVFDSGIGGLTVMNRLKEALPHESFIYFGDTARIPYGGKNKETIIRYSIDNAVFLMEQNIKLLVVACNTASAFSLEKLRQIFNVPVIGVIRPGAEKAVSVTKSKKIAVLGTKGTILSGAYQQEILACLPDAKIFPLACPLFVPLVEEQFSCHPAAKLIVKEYLSELTPHCIDTLLLGCTHYPLLKDLIQEEVGPDTVLVDSASTCAEKVAQTLLEEGLERGPATPSHRYFVSDDPEKFKELVKKLFDYTIDEVSLHTK